MEPYDYYGPLPDDFASNLWDDLRAIHYSLIGLPGDIAGEMFQYPTMQDGEWTTQGYVPGQENWESSYDAMMDDWMGMDPDEREQILEDNPIASFVGSMSPILIPGSAFLPRRIPDTTNYDAITRSANREQTEFEELMHDATQMDDADAWPFIYADMRGDAGFRSDIQEFYDEEAARLTGGMKPALTEDFKRPLYVTGKEDYADPDKVPVATGYWPPYWSPVPDDVKEELKDIWSNASFMQLRNQDYANELRFPPSREEELFQDYRDAALAYDNFPTEHNLVTMLDTQNEFNWYSKARSDYLTNTMAWTDKNKSNTTEIKDIRDIWDTNLDDPEEAQDLLDKMRIQGNPAAELEVLKHRLRRAAHRPPGTERFVYTDMNPWEPEATLDTYQNKLSQGQRDFIHWITKEFRTPGADERLDNMYDVMIGDGTRPTRSDKDHYSDLIDIFAGEDDRHDKIWTGWGNTTDPWHPVRNARTKPFESDDIETIWERLKFNNPNDFFTNDKEFEEYLDTLDDEQKMELLKRMIENKDK